MAKALPKGQKGLQVPAGKGKAAPALVQDSWGAGAQKGWAQNQQWEGPAAELPTIVLVNITQDSQLTAQGFPPEAPCLSYINIKGVSVFSCAHNLLSELVGDISSEVEFHHDPEWTLFPEVASAIKAAGGEENCFGIATCPSQCKWAIGVGSGWKSRESACKLALAFALASSQPPLILHTLAQNYPEFGALLAENGLLPGRPKKVPVALPPTAAHPSAPNTKGKSWQAPAAKSKAQKQEAFDHSLQESSGQPITLWITLPDDSRLVEDGFPKEGPSVYHDKSCSELISTGHYILEEAVGNLKENVIFNHDPDWDVLPEVLAAIKEVGGEEGCYCVATMPSQGIWAVGLAGGWKPRESAAKLALCLALFSKSDGLFEIASRYPDFAAYASVVGAGVNLPALKKRKVEETPPLSTSTKGKGSAVKGAALASKGAASPGKGQAAKVASPAAKVMQTPSGKGSGAKNGGKLNAKPLPREKPLWIQLPSDQLAPVQLQELGPDAVAVATDHGASPLYQSLDGLISHLLSSEEVSIDYIDDPKCEQFPSIYAALKQYTEGQEPIQLAVLGSLGCWGIGAGRSPDCRLAAAKLAVASMITLRAAETGDVPDLSDFPDFSEFVGGITPPM